MKGKWIKFAVSAVLTAGLAAAASYPDQTFTGSSDRLAGKVRHEILMLPYYGVFDAIGFHVNGSKVILSGEVTRPTLKSDIGRIVARLEGVSAVENKIEVLPMSPFDDR